MHTNGPMWPMGGMMIGWLLLTVLIVGLVVWLAVSYARPRGGTEDTGTARRILAERYARGELDTEEYNERLAALR
ncbi:SHOCT domain-containing protein [Actinoplanes sp. NPDC049802]|uniref:SHOCT domain-containing protein n=1 Tax=Actinoplanes sp. NPDC049802 TaxID=3154742 RepID=UPI00340438CF